MYISRKVVSVKIGTVLDFVNGRKKVFVVFVPAVHVPYKLPFPPVSGSRGIQAGKAFFQIGLEIFHRTGSASPGNLPMPATLIFPESGHAY